MLPRFEHNIPWDLVINILPLTYLGSQRNHFHWFCKRQIWYIMPSIWHFELVRAERRNKEQKCKESENPVAHILLISCVFNLIMRRTAVECLSSPEKTCTHCLHTSYIWFICILHVGCTHTICYSCSKDHQYTRIYCILYHAMSSVCGRKRKFGDCANSTIGPHSHM